MNISVVIRMNVFHINLEKKTLTKNKILLISRFLSSKILLSERNLGIRAVKHRIFLSIEPT